MTAAGRFDGDNAEPGDRDREHGGAGARAILITPSDTKAIVPAIRKARAAGVLVIALDSPTDPQDATDALIATDNFKAGLLIGSYAKAVMAGKSAKIATLDLTPASPSASCGTTASCRATASRTAIRASCAAPTRRAIRPRVRRRWRTASREHRTSTSSTPSTSRQQREPIARSEPPDGRRTCSSCRSTAAAPGVRNVKAGMLAATSQQYPLKMASLGVEAAVEYAKTGKKVSGTIDTGVTLITDKPMKGVDSRDSAFGLNGCWGK